MKIWVIFVCLAGTAIAQPVSVGIKGGVPITDFFNTVQNQPGGVSLDNTKRYLIGPTVEFHGPLGLSLEIDALYRRIGYQYQITSVDTITEVRTRATPWDFPVLVKWAFLPGPIKPFIDAGVNVRHVFNVHEVETLTVAPSRATTTVSDTSTDLIHPTTVGFAFGGGVQLKIGWLRIEPEFRYYRWGNEAFRNPLHEVLSTNLNQGDFILGVTF